VCIIGCVAVARGVSGARNDWRPEGVSVVAYASPTEVTVGDKILYTLGVAVPEGIVVSWPSVGRTLGDFHARDLGQQDAGRIENGKEKFSRLYELRVFETGYKYIPSLTVALKNERGNTAELRTGEISVHVKSVLDENARDIKDIKPPIALSYFPGRLLLWFVLGCAAVAAIMMWAMRRKTKKVEIEAPPSPPHVIAYEELRRILAMNLVEKGRIKEYYVRISDVVRRYIEDRFHLMAPERTTEEFLIEAKASGLLDARARTLVGDFLEQCDMVKFAKYGPTNEECEAAYRAARRFVDETKEETMGT
jgi:hypothetical protein